MHPLPALLLLTWLVALTGDTAAPGPLVYRNEKFGYVVVVPKGYERLPAAAPGEKRAFDLRILDRERSVLAAMYAVSGPRTDDRAVITEMHRYLLEMEKDKALLLLDGPARVEVDGRHGAAWTMLHLEDGMVWKMAVIPHDTGGHSQIYVTVIMVTDPETAERLEVALPALLRAVRFVPAPKR